LSDPEVTDVLRYWLGSMRYQEALAARPKAQPLAPGDSDATSSVPPNLVQPTPGRKYMKLDWAGHEAFISARRGHVELDLDAEAKGLFEDWLATNYRRGDDDEDGRRVGHLLGFPTLLLPKGDLGCLLRSPLDVLWRTAEAAEFNVPSPAQRAASKLPQPPARVRLLHGGRDTEDALPFFVDLKLLADVLRVDAERLDRFFNELRQKRAPRPRAMVTALSALIEAQIVEDGGARGQPRPPNDNAGGSASARALSALHAALTRRLAQLGSRTRAYPIALVVSADQSRVTTHAQRDIEAALDRLADKRLKRDSPLSRYVRGLVSERDAPRTERCLGRFTPSGLTPHQRAALELSLDRRLCAIQGPPGTGKTTLIINRVADALVRKVLPLLDGHAMGDGVLVITSTNNAAVDNVTSVLGSALGPDRLPLALRAGSRDVTERVTSADLETCLAWLERHRQSPVGELPDTLDAFRALHTSTRSAAAAEVAPPERGEALGHALFLAAERVRLAWVVKNRENLLNVLTLALRAAKQSRSLAAVLANTNKGGAWLKRLFPAFGSTLLSLGNVFPAEPDCIEHVVIDEAGQCHPGYAVSALLRASSALIIGDVHQLQPVIGLSLDDERRFVRSLRLGIDLTRLEPYRTHDEAGTSAQHLADRAVPLRPTLIDHFRCQPAIAAICEQLCQYGLEVRTPPSSRSGMAPRLTAAVLAVDLPGEQERQAGSWANELEVREVVAWVQYLLSCGIQTDDLGVITPFRGQLERLTQAFATARIPVDEPLRGADQNLDLFGTPSRGLALGTVHRFQGGERSIILLSTTVTRVGSLRFLDERENLVNVAASRARDHLITVGHAATLLAGRHTRALLSDALRVPALGS
jgi:hypothetical protein